MIFHEVIHMSDVITNLPSLLAGIAVMAVLLAVLVHLIRQKKAGKSSCSSCGNCSGACCACKGGRKPYGGLSQPLKIDGKEIRIKKVKA